MDSNLTLSLHIGVDYWDGQEMQPLDSKLQEMFIKTTYLVVPIPDW